MARIARGLDKSLDVSRVTTNLHTGAITVYHDEAMLDDIRDTLKDLGVILLSATDVPIPEDDSSGEGFSLTGAVADLDRRLGTATNGLVNLRVLVPAGFGALAIVQLLRRGLELGTAPWYVLAYVAFDSYRRLHLSEATSEYSPADENQRPRRRSQTEAVVQD
jgi:hypothetical protein